MTKRMESQLVTACLEFLQVHENLGNIAWCDRLNSGTAFVGDFGESSQHRKGMKRKVRLCRPGTPDIFVLLKPAKLDHPGTIVWIECKNENGKQMEEQQAFEQMANRNGHYYFIVRELDELVRILQDLRNN